MTSFDRQDSMVVGSTGGRLIGSMDFGRRFCE